MNNVHSTIVTLGTEMIKKIHLLTDHIDNHWLIAWHVSDVAGYELENYEDKHI